MLCEVCRAIEVFSGEGCCNPLQIRPLGTVLISLVGLILVALALFLILSYIQTS